MANHGDAALALSRSDLAAIVRKRPHGLSWDEANRLPCFSRPHAFTPLARAEYLADAKTYSMTDVTRRARALSGAQIMALLDLCRAGFLRAGYAHGWGFDLSADDIEFGHAERTIASLINNGLFVREADGKRVVLSGTGRLVADAIKLRSSR